MVKCSPKGRDCFETHSSQTFNCIATCEGVYAGVLWEADTIKSKDMKAELVEQESEGAVGEEVKREMERLENKLMRKIKLLEGSKEMKVGEEIDKEKFKKLISEYKKFKMENVRHFRFHQNATTNMFGRSCLSDFK